MSAEIAWQADAAASYVMCVYGDDGAQPGDCYTRVGQDEDGWWWADDGDDIERPETYGPFRSEAEAREKAQAVADAQNEAEPGEDAEDMLDRSRAEAAGEPDPEGEYAVYWETVGDDAHPVERYSSEEAAEARAAQMQDGLHRSHPGGPLLCGYGVRRLVEGEWVETKSA